MTYPLTTAPISNAPIQADAMARLGELITTHIQDKRYPGAQIALAYKGSLVWEQSFGQARVGQGHEADTKAVAADNQSLWLLYSNTKVCCTTSGGTPALVGLPNVARPEPALTNNASAWPW